MRLSIAVFPILCLCLASAPTVYAKSSLDNDYSNFRSNVRSEIPDLVVNRPVNIQGMTGLMVTNSAYTQPKGRFTVGFSSLGETEKNPDYSIVQGIISGVYGITDRIEAGFKAKALSTEFETGASGKKRETGAGDTDLLFKWRMTSQGDDLPALAVGMALTLPTGDEKKNFREVKNEGVRLMLMGAHESELPGGIVVGLYVDGQLVLIDQLESSKNNPHKDKYGIVNMGMLFPVTENNQWQAIIEYNIVTKKGVPSPIEQNSNALTPSLRFVTEKLNVTAGAQFLSRSDAGAQNTTRYVGTVSYQF